MTCKCGCTEVSVTIDPDRGEWYTGRAKCEGCGRETVYTDDDVSNVLDTLEKMINGKKEDWFDESQRIL